MIFLQKIYRKRIEDTSTRHAKGKVIGITALVSIFLIEQQLFPATEIRIFNRLYLPVFFSCQKSSCKSLNCYSSHMDELAKFTDQVTSAIFLNYYSCPCLLQSSCSYGLPSKDKVHLDHIRFLMLIPSVRQITQKQFGWQ